MGLNFEIDKINSIGITNTKTGTTYSWPVNAFVEADVTKSSDDEEHKVIIPDFSQLHHEVTMEIDSVSFADAIKDMWKKVENAKPNYSIISINMIQCRKHRKRRINKKWAKRYGFKEIVRKIPIRNIQEISGAKVREATDEMISTFKFIVDDAALEQDLYSTPIFVEK